MGTIKGSFTKYGDTLVNYEIADEQKDKIVERLIKYYSTHCYFGEGIHQDDDSIIDAPSVLSDICDNIIEFKSERLRMNKKIYEYVKKYLNENVSWYKGKEISEKNVIDYITDDYEWYDEGDSRRWWKTHFCVTKIGDMYIGYTNAFSDGDMSASDRGFEFDPESICEAEPFEVTVVKYRKKEIEK